MTSAANTITLDGRRFSMRANRVGQAAEGVPLVVALHGGGYNSAYFDVPGFSLLDRAERLGIPVLAFDRPGYGESEVLAPGEHAHAANAAILDAAIGVLYARHPGRPGVVLIGHSIGGAIAVGIAARKPDWLLGIAVSGVGLKNMPGDLEMWQSLPRIPFIELPSAVKDGKMFGVSGTYDAGAPERSHVADAPAPLQELLDIVTVWPDNVSALLAAVAVPVHYRQADADALWQVSADEVERFGDACVAAPWHDARLVADAGHCIDFHKLGAALQLDQLAFALTCGVRRAIAR
ncbi:alpha/beta hydrolase [Sphingomonas sp. CL5.1]|uniref:alpha/beta hydrolase n=1 Tax=Sphingomonas sp. CL5.1 TaxID=2653203 RepID=UPI00158168ED|nr:alpha/beta fold hydrolase [Sphingomonas sp. CL5.1]QKR99779.1 alpha/beta hydrolase [Sphingomonas sp. CL5.1]